MAGCTDSPKNATQYSILSINIDLTELAREVSHNIWRQVEDGLGYVNVMVTISATDKAEKSENNFLLGDSMKNQLLDKYV